MRILVNLFMLITATALSTTTLASLANRVATTKQPTTPNQAAPQVIKQQQADAAHPSAANQLPPKTTTASSLKPQAVASNRPYESDAPQEAVLLPGSKILPGNPDKNEFFIVGQNDPTPPALIAEQQEAQAHAEKVQVAVDETAKTIQQANALKLEKALGENSSKLNKEVQASNAVVSPTLKQTPGNIEAANDVNPSLGSMLKAPVTADTTIGTAPATEASPSTKESITNAMQSQAEAKPNLQHDVVEAQNDVNPQVGSALNPSVLTDATPAVVDSGKTAPVTSKQTKKPQVHHAKVNTKSLHVRAAAKTRHVLAVKSAERSINIKKKLAQVEVVRMPKAKVVPQVKVVKHPVVAAKSKTVHPAKQALSKTPGKKVHLSLAKTESEVKYHHTTFKVKTLQVQ